MTVDSKRDASDKAHKDTAHKNADPMAAVFDSVQKLAGAFTRRPTESAAVTAREIIKPKIGLALGGGVARGWSHIGVLRALQELGIEPDIVCGTSVGALAGGAYLAGKLGALEEWARSLTRRRIIGYLDVRLDGSGLLGGERLMRLLREQLDSIRIEDLPKPFAAVCTELATGHEIWIRDGSLVEALRASYGLPGVFAPVKRDHRWLIDGALVNPVPISVCRALGARLVIGVTLHTDTFGAGNLETNQNINDMDFHGGDPARGAALLGHKRDHMFMRQIFGAADDAPGLGTVMLGALNIILDRIARSRMASDPADVLIAPRLGHISLLDFDRAEELIALGYEAMMREADHVRNAIAVLS